MKAKLTSSYPARKGFGRTFVFVVTGTPDEVADYIGAQGDNCVYEDDANPDSSPLFFNSKSIGLQVGQSGKLVKSHDGSYYRLDDSAYQAQRQMLIEQELIRLEAQHMFNVGGSVDFTTGEVNNQMLQSSEPLVEEPTAEPIEA